MIDLWETIDFNENGFPILRSYDRLLKAPHTFVELLFHLLNYAFSQVTISFQN